MEYLIKEEGKFKYLDIGEGEETIVLLHGLFGSMSNFKGVIENFKKEYRVIVPILPIYELSLHKAGLGGLKEYVTDFIKFKDLDHFHVLGNSLGGHLAQLFTLENQEKISSLILTGSSGLFENSLGGSYPKISNYEYVKEKAKQTFYDPAIATKEMVDEVFDTINDRGKALRLLLTAKSAIRHNLSKRLHDIKVPTLLVWGKNDNITPLFVGEKFNELIPNSELAVVEKCGHAPMMEVPNKFNSILTKFLEKQKSKT